MYPDSRQPVDLPHMALLGLELVNASITEVASHLAARPASAAFTYVVTPNADHFVRLSQDTSGLRSCYDSAGIMLLDSRVVHWLAQLLRLPVPPVVTGSDLTEHLLSQVIAADEPVTIIGTTSVAVQRMSAKYGLSRLAHLAPPFGFENRSDLIEACADFIRDHPARFVFLACGAPRQEILARRVVERGDSVGIGLCIGAAIDQIGGHERRAPVWMRRTGFEWAWRILQEPRRLGRRYFSNLAIISLLSRERRRR